MPARLRFRWAADKAGYATNTPIAQITKPLTAEITACAERMLMEASITAANVYIDVLNGDNIDVIKTKHQLVAAQAIMDRAVPKKEQIQKQQGPLVQIVLPAKDAPKKIEIIDG